MLRSRRTDVGVGLVIGMMATRLWGDVKLCDMIAFADQHDLVSTLRHM